jgi:hypothetical protein
MPFGPASFITTRQLEWGEDPCFRRKFSTFQKKVMIALQFRAAPLLRFVLQKNGKSPNSRDKMDNQPCQFRQNGIISKYNGQNSREVLCFGLENA